MAAKRPKRCRKERHPWTTGLASAAGSTQFAWSRLKDVKSHPQDEQATKPGPSTHVAVSKSATLRRTTVQLKFMRLITPCPCLSQ